MVVPDLRAGVSWVTPGCILDGKGHTTHPVSPITHIIVLLKPFDLKTFKRLDRWFHIKFYLKKLLYLNWTVPLSMMGRSVPIRLSEFGFIGLVFVFRQFHHSVLWLLQFSSFLSGALIPPAHLKTNGTQSTYEPHKLWSRICSSGKACMFQ